MNELNTHNMDAPSALIYCRVSSTKQRVDGSGLESQEQRCRSYADMHGYAVEAVFPDDVSGGGDFMKRPGMVALLSFLDAQPGKPYVIIFDDLKRFARDRDFHWKLRKALTARGAVPKCLNFNFEDTPEGEFIETIMAAQGHLEREQNRRQVIQKMKARVENGFWVFRAPVGYKHIPAKGGGGKVLVPNEPLASVVREALEGYAHGRFSTQNEVKLFLENDPHFPKDRKDGTLRPMTITRLLKKVVYAGYVEAPKWGVSVREGQHEGLISFETYQRIQDNLEGKKRAPAARKDYHVDFPLRGFVACNCCGNAMTAAWSTGKTKRYAYYRCETRGCEEKSKCIPRAKLEDGFEAILRSLAPSKKLFELARVIFADVWEMRSQQVRSQQAEWKRQLKEAEKQIEELLDRLVDHSSLKPPFCNNAD
ncbi:recombinase family protein [Paracoccus panacisoli]|uniref:Recombinase family protein n=1 Tax=Paracoccus panacisoli TaxID=1510163 RepID=A0ABV6T282_9RHOB